VAVISLLIMAAIAEVKRSGAAVTYAAIQREFVKRLAERARERAQMIAETEAARAAGVGEHLVIIRTDVGVGHAVSKTWLRTTSKNPRDIHLAQVGITVPFNATFPDGSYWSNELPYCKCGIQVNYE
jgi:hypothetical protein